MPSSSAIVLVLVYVGAVMVLFLFVVMMLDINIERFRKGSRGYWPLGGRRGGVRGVRDHQRDRGRGSWRRGLKRRAGAAGATTATRRARHGCCYTSTPTLEIAAVILLVASVAAIVLTLRRRAGHKPQDIAAQVAVRAKDRCGIVKMASGAEEP